MHVCESSNTDTCTHRSAVNSTLVICTELFCKCIYRLKADAELMNVEYYALKKNMKVFKMLPYCKSMHTVALLFVFTNMFVLHVCIWVSKFI